MNVVFRVDASIKIGSGHVMRCLTLADELQRYGANIVFICRELIGHMIDLIEKKGYEVVRLPTPLKKKPCQKDDVEHAWLLELSWEQDAIESLKALNGCYQEWLIIDHYGLDYRWSYLLRPMVKNIMVIDDLADRVHDCDILLDQNLYHAMESRYNNLTPTNCQKLLGPYYALLRPEFNLYRNNLCKKNGQIKRILVFFGGMDLTNMTEKALEALLKIENRQFAVDVVVGSCNPYKEKIKFICETHYKFNYYCQVDDIASLMFQADFSIGAGGTTTWERCALGLPGVVVSIAKNQLELATYAAEIGISFLLGDEYSTSSETIETAVRTFLLSPYNLLGYSNRCLEIVDAKGVQRVARAIMPKKITMRLASLEDSNAMFEWRNSEETRKHSFSQKKISRNSHNKWLINCLNRADCIILIGDMNSEPIGVVRYDISAGEALISIYLVPGNYGQSIGTELLKSSKQWLKENKPSIQIINAHILPDNLASKKVFEQAGYDIHYIAYRDDIT